MTAIVLIVVAAAAIIGMSIVFGGPIVGAILAVVLIVGGIVWFLSAGGSGRTPGEVAREAPDRRAEADPRAGVAHEREPAVLVEHEAAGVREGGPDDPER